MAQQFNRRQVELILRRTAELERPKAEPDGALTSEDLTRIAADLGMSEAALRQAMAEAGAGLLTGDTPRTLADRWFGPALVEVRRFVPGDVATVRAAVERFLGEQGFQLKRHRGDVTIWEAGDVWTRLRRAFSAGPYRLPRDVEIEARVAAVPGGPHPVLVNLRVDARAQRRSSGGATAAAAVVGAAGAVAGTVLLPMPIELVAMAGGSAVAALGALGARSGYRDRHARLSLALERFCDFLEHEPVRAPAGAAQKDPITRLVDFLSSEWWK